MYKNIKRSVRMYKNAFSMSEMYKIYKDIENSQGQGAFFFENTGIVKSGR